MVSLLAWQVLSQSTDETRRLHSAASLPQVISHNDTWTPRYLEAQLLCHASSWQWRCQAYDFGWFQASVQASPSPQVTLPNLAQTKIQPIWPTGGSQLHNVVNDFNEGRPSTAFKHRHFEISLTMTDCRGTKWLTCPRNRTNRLFACSSRPSLNQRRFCGFPNFSLNFSYGCMSFGARNALNKPSSSSSSSSSSSQWKPFQDLFHVLLKILTNGQSDLY